MQKAYQGASQGGNCGQQYSQGYQQSNAGPSADEVDWGFWWFFFVNQLKISVSISFNSTFASF